MSAQTHPLEVLSQECVTTDLLGRICKECGENIDHMRSNATHCSRKCQKHSVRNADQKIKQRVTSMMLARLNRDRYIGFDGKYEGPLNQCFTVLVNIRKDRGYHSMPIDVHVKPVEPKFSQVTPEDVVWAERQKAFTHTQSMPRLFNSFCAVCTDVVIDSAKKEARVTRGVYLPIEHVCGKMRVYDLQGNLLKVETL